MAISLVILVVLMLGALTLAGWAVSLYNGLVAVKNQVELCWSDIDVALKQRHDELTKLIEVVKGVRDFESQTLEKVVAARGAFAGAATRAEMMAGAQAETMALRGLFAVVEAYPQLKADENFRQLQSRISVLEDQIAGRRELYNDAVNIFNTRIEQFPDSVAAGLLAYHRREYFRIEDADRSDVIPHL